MNSEQPTLVLAATAADLALDVDSTAAAAAASEISTAIQLYRRQACIAIATGAHGPAAIKSALTGLYGVMDRYADLGACDRESKDAARSVFLRPFGMHGSDEVTFGLTNAQEGGSRDSASTWGLYETEGGLEASRRLDSAFDEARTAGWLQMADGASRHTATIAVLESMHRVMADLKSFGASDSEAHQELGRRMSSSFGSSWDQSPRNYPKAHRGR